MASLVPWILSGAVPSLVLYALVLFGAVPSRNVVAACAAITVVWLATVAMRIRSTLSRHVRRLNNLVEAARAQDYSIRAVIGTGNDGLSELYGQINALINDLEGGRQAEQELLAMLRKVVGRIRVGIVVCDAQDRIRLVNPAAARLLAVSPEQSIGVEFSRTSLADIPMSEQPRTVDFRFPGAESRWQVSQLWYRHQSKPSRIVFIVDLRQVLADEEILMWQRLIRVISHEVNNSLAPISSLCQTLESILSRGPLPGRESTIVDGLQVIGQRARGLQEFISVYSRVARLPEANKIVFTADRLIERVCGMFSPELLSAPPEYPRTRLYGDPVHLEQALINLIKNALEANADSPDPVILRCRIRDGSFEFEILDNGPGIANPANLFVPFYTTKEQGAGIGLVLSRNIVAMHHGSLALENRRDSAGAIARLILPLPPED